MIRLAFTTAFQPRSLSWACQDFNEQVRAAGRSAPEAERDVVARRQITRIK